MAPSSRPSALALVPWRWHQELVLCLAACALCVVPWLLSERNESPNDGVRRLEAGIFLHMLFMLYVFMMVTFHLTERYNRVSWDGFGRVGTGSGLFQRAIFPVG